MFSNLFDFFVLLFWLMIVNILLLFTNGNCLFRVVVMENCAKRWQTREGTYQLKRRRLKPDVRDSPEYLCADIDMADIHLTI